MTMSIATCYRDSRKQPPTEHRQWLAITTYHQEKGRSQKKLVRMHELRSYSMYA